MNTDKTEGTVTGGVAIIFLVVILGFMMHFITSTITIPNLDTAIKLPLLIITGLSILIVLLAILTMSFWSINLTDKTQPLGLPEGSIRAVIALALVVIFSILSVFLYLNISQGGELHTITSWSLDEINKFIGVHPTLTNIDISEIKDNQSVKYNFTYHQSNTESNDFAKQLLVLLGTLMTSVISFYLGSKTSMAVSGVAQPQPPPLLRSVTPNEAKIEDNDGVVHLKIEGDNLNSIKQVKIVNTENNKQIIGTNVVSNDSVITCDVKVDEKSIGDWNVIVVGSSESSAPLQKALKIGHR